MTELDPGDQKIVVLARSTRARVGAADGAAVRDTDGCIYAAATVSLPSLRLRAAGAPGLEDAAVVTADGADPDAESVAAVRDLGPPVPVLVADASGTVRGVLNP